MLCVTEILNYISAWVTLLAVVLGLCVFLFERASKKNPFRSTWNQKKNWLASALNKKDFFALDTLDGWLKKHYFPLLTVEIW
jgi:uncharacterized membrane protein YkvI